MIEEENTLKTQAEAEEAKRMMEREKVRGEKERKKK
jgi:hypothetical protein